MTKSRDIFTTDRLYVTYYDAIWKQGSKQIWVSVSLLSIFFLQTWKKYNQSLSNDWPTYCHTGIPNKQQILNIMSSWMNIRFALYDYIDNCRLLNLACIGLLPSDGEVSLIYFQRKTFYFEHRLPRLLNVGDLIKKRTR